MKTLILLLLNFLALSLVSQNVPKYTFSSRVENYVPLDASATNLTENYLWDDEVYMFPLGFEMNYLGHIVTTLNFDTYGILYSDESYVDTLEGPAKVLLLFADYLDRGWINDSAQSPISYTTVGNQGDQITKLEVKNAGFFVDEDSSNTDFVNYQIWFYEKDASIEIHFGPKQIAKPGDDFAGTGGPLVGLVYGISFDINTETQYLDSCLLVQGSPNNFRATDYTKKLNFANPLIYFNRWPNENQVFRFSPKVNTASKDVSKSESLEIIPNPAIDHFTIKHLVLNSKSNLKLIDIVGHEVNDNIYTVTQKNDGVEFTFTSTLNPGLYSLQIQTESKNYFGKFYVK